MTTFLKVLGIGRRERKREKIEGETESSELSPASEASREVANLT